MIHTYLPSVSGPPAPLAGMRGVIQGIDMASKPIEDPATQVAACDVPRAKLEVDTCVRRATCLVRRAKLDIDYMTNKAVLSSTDLNKHRQLLAASVAARQRFSRHSNSEGLV